jgi:pimeloyl-ACP methyl ester carboxylesterase
MTDDVVKDLIVVLPGIMGSTLAKQGKLVWSPSAGSIVRAIASFGSSINELQLPDGIGDEHPDDGVVPVGLMPDLHALPGIWTVQLGYDLLLQSLRQRFHLVEAPLDDPDRFANFLPVAYDWRLSNRFNGRRLKTIVEPALERWRAQGSAFRDAKVVFICHSMGGLVARWYLDKEGGAEICRKVITLGTPYRGALKALRVLVNGVPFSLGLTHFARSLPSLYQLLPEYACIESSDGLRRTTEVAVPEISRSHVADAMRFHDELDAVTERPYDLHPVVGFRQPTATTARIVGAHVHVVKTIDGEDEGGDATVPRLSATPKSMRPDDVAIRSVAERHGSLQNHQSILDEIEFVLTARRTPHRAAGAVDLIVDMDDLVREGEPVTIGARPSDGSNTLLLAQIENESGRVVASGALAARGGEQRAAFDPLPPGGYVVTVSGAGSAAQCVAPVHCPLLVWSDRWAHGS